MQGPILNLGPGGSYTTTYYSQDNKLTKVSSNTRKSPARRKKRVFVFRRKTQNTQTQPSTQLITATAALLAIQIKTARLLLRHLITIKPAPTNSPNTETHNESDPKTITHPHPNQGSAYSQRLLPDHAGASRRAGRDQSHGLRARRGPHQKRRAHQASQQGTLFGD